MAGERTVSEMLKDFARVKPVLLQPINQTFVNVTFKGDGAEYKDYVRIGIEQIGDVVGSIDRDYDGAKNVTRISYQLDPNNKGSSLIGKLGEIVVETKKNEMYSKILEERKKAFNGAAFNGYLGLWNEGSADIRGEVVGYLMRAYDFIQEKWPEANLTRERVISSEKPINISRVRSALMYCLRENFVDDKGHSRLSFPQVGRIFGGKNHATVLLATRRVKAALAGLDEVDVSNVEESIEQIVGALGGIKRLNLNNT